MADRSGRGVVGARPLVAVQTVDVGRLTSHPVFLAPSSLIAVTGKGPRDSNESSKTMFFAAVTLLLGDPGWRPESPQTGQHAARLLFNPPNARQLNVAADHGYIVGVFASTDRRAAGEEVTVWLRINRSGDPAYVQVRHTGGIALADGDTQEQRRSAADRRWADLPSSRTLGLRTYREALYGDGTTCLSYVATRGGRVEARDRTLLGSEVSQLAPDQIADELFRLAGVMPRLEVEQEQRAEYLQMRRRSSRLEDELEEAEEVLRRAEAEQQAIERLAGDLDDAVALRRLATARSALEAVEGLRDDREALDELVEARSRAEEEVEAARGQLQDLDTAELERDHQQARSHLEAAEQAMEQAREQAARARADRDHATDELTGLREQAAGWDGTPPEAAEQQLAAADEQLREATERLGAARHAHEQAATHLEAVRRGDAGPVVGALAEAGVPAELLRDGVRIADGHRARWEALLHPFRDAVAVPGDRRGEALAAISERPGALLASGPDPERTPEGVEAFPAGGGALLALLDDLAGDTEHTATPLAEAAVLVGGFEEPTTGRAARVAAAERAEAKARRRLEQAEQGHAQACQVRERAAATEASARAAAAAERLEEQVLPDLRARVSELAREVEEARERQAEARETEAEARARLAGVHQLADAAEERLRRAQEQSAEADRKAREQRRRADQRRVGAWAGRLAAADAIALDGPLVERLRGASPTDADPGDLDGLASACKRLLDGETRAAHTLRRNAREHLTAEVLAGGLEVHIDRSRRSHRRTTTRVEVPEALPEGLGEATRRFIEAGEAGGDVTGAAIRQDQAFDALVDTVREVVAVRRRRAEAATDRAREAAERLRGRYEDASQETRAARFALENLMSSIEDLARSLLDGISAAFGRIRAADGVGHADLRVTHHRPSLDDDDASTKWRWEVRPRWARGGADDARLVDYRRDANTAQYKLATIQLVLAALTANSDPGGRVLVLDELGANLGEDHRDRVVRALARAAEEADLTVMATVQDDLQDVAFRHSREILLLHYRSRQDLLNAPTRMLATDPTGGDAIRPLADAFAQGDRDIAWQPLWEVYDPALDVDGGEPAHGAA